MLHCKTKKQIGRVLTVVLLAACMFLNLVSIPHFIASVSAAVSPTDVSSEEPGISETVPDVTSDESYVSSDESYVSSDESYVSSDESGVEDGAENGAADSAQQASSYQEKMTIMAPLRQFMDNIFPYTT
ncbi:MAG: hypothetical protein VZR73_07290, partial [Acutalibacteraceae bacterium]|nr:hypothetical protein [Acutalibacteraceae bacterium]